jgi:hypothetical protein
MNRIHLIDTKYERQEGKETPRDPRNSIITSQTPTGYTGMLAQLRCPFQHICSKITSRFACERHGGKLTPTSESSRELVVPPNTLSAANGAELATTMEVARIGERREAAKPSLLGLPFLNFVIWYASSPIVYA